MIDHQKRVLDMLAEGKISVDEAERLLAAMAQPSDGDAGAPQVTEARQKPLEQVSVKVEPDAQADSAGTRDDTFAVGDSPTLVVNSQNARIVVNSGPDNAIRVQAKLRNPAKVDYQVRQDGDTVRVDARRKGKAFLLGFLGDGGRAHIAVTAPRRTNVELTTGNGRIELNGIEGSSKLRTSNGRIVMQDVKGDLDATTSNSRIELREMEGSGTLRTSNGRIAMENVKGQFNAVTSNGSISFTGEMTPGGSNQLETSNGSVNVRLQGTPSLRIDASTSNGRVTSRLPVQTVTTGDRRHLVGTIGEGEAQLLARSSNGSITIE